MISIGRKIYYELATGNIIQEISERSGSVIETSTENDFQIYKSLQDKNKDSIGIIQLKYGELKNEFSNCTSYRIDITKGVIDKNAIVFSYTSTEAKLKEVKERQKEIISSSCEIAINSGFTSTAYQGIQKIYNNTLVDQTNIIGLAFSAISKLAGTIGCENDKFYYHAQGEDFVEWSVKDILQLARDMKTFKETQLFKSKVLQNYIETLPTVSEVQSVNWNTEIPMV